MRNFGAAERMTKMMERFGLEEGQELQHKWLNRSVETAHLGFTTSPHEECAVEEAVQLAEAARSAGGDATVTVLTLGPPEAEEQLRYAASVGADEAISPERALALFTTAAEAPGGAPPYSVTFWVVDDQALLEVKVDVEGNGSVVLTDTVHERFP